MIDNLEGYRAFLAVAQSGSFSKAAEKLGVTQPAVSHTVRRLEERLGGPLFYRTPAGVRLTGEGEMLYKFVSQAFHFLENGERKIAEMRNLVAGEVKIGAGDTLCRHYLLPHLEAFHREYPGVKIQVTNRTTRETIALLKEGKIDFGIVNLPVKDSQLVIRESIPLHDCFVAGEAFRSLTERTLTWRELVLQPLILLEQGSNIRAYVDRFAKGQGVDIRPEFELGSIDLLVQFARIGLGIACVIREFVADELAKGTLHEIRLEKPLPPRRVGLVTLKEVPLSAAASRFLEKLP
ncbi:MAG: LysR family transcriptional regulator [Thermobacillus sp. ZCTH02-B1]|uniref:LysR family transcriptional regulator n=1 Tax=Thermobacillus sp. ZCTH02-B1 TaxID=1858795 RepID=UPI000B56E8CC|nr:LysR family transcriptional regulator [Thermobacillus sp. ZCTH02-B1]OUM95823.1 MAG: LysR family transcriptional regulator [Thermobacillus sp. ZCTH02-B1]